MNPRVKSVTPRDDFRLEITFTNKEKGVYDCRHLLEFGVFKELKDRRYFTKARAVAGTVAWPHDQDICPDTLYMGSLRTIPKTARRAKRISRPRPRSG